MGAVQSASMHALEVAALAATVVSLAVYLGLQGAFFVSMHRGTRSAPPIVSAPRVTIYKPLAGVDDDLAANLASLADLDYPSFEVIFGVAAASDPALPVARSFVREHPEIAARIVITDPEAAINPKVAQLVCMDRHATGEVVVISDSNVRLSPHYLWTLVRELTVPGTGMATTLFAGSGERTIGAALENLQLGTVTTPGIAVFALLSNRPFTVGKSMAIWRRDLARVGGFGRVGDVLAEDYVLGRLFFSEGLGVRTSYHVVENRNVDCSMRRTFERHARWAKMRRALAPAAFAMEPFASPLAIATLSALLAPSATTVTLLVVAAMVQTAFAMLDLRVLRGRALAWYWAPLEIVRTYLVLACWLAAACSRRITWRGNPFKVMRGTVIVPAPRSSWSRRGALS
jgi:ceramide glucosyltransferase